MTHLIFPKSDMKRRVSLCEEGEYQQRGGTWNVVKDDMQEVGAKEDEQFERSAWRIRTGDP